MKTTIKLLAMTLFAVFFTSCCNSHRVGTIQGEKTILEYEYTGAKSGLVSVERKVPVTHECRKCGSWFCPKPECCGITNRSVLSRATGQSGSGEPHIGLIPTMKTLAP